MKRIICWGLLGSIGMLWSCGEEPPTSTTPAQIDAAWETVAINGVNYLAVAGKTVGTANPELQITIPIRYTIESGWIRLSDTLVVAGRKYIYEAACANAARRDDDDDDHDDDYDDDRDDDDYDDDDYDDDDYDDDRDDDDHDDDYDDDYDDDDYDDDDHDDDYDDDYDDDDYDD